MIKIHVFGIFRFIRFPLFIIALSIPFFSEAQEANGFKNSAKYPTELQHLHQNVLKHILDEPLRGYEIKNLCTELTQNGSWPDIDYTSVERGGWPPAGHFSRILALAKVYHTGNSGFYQDKEVLERIHLALNFWFANDYICPNWWYPQIGIPKILNPIMLLMEFELSPQQMKQGIKILDRSKLGMTGQNKVWQAGNVLLKSLLLRDVETIKKAVADIQSELIVSFGEGVQHDWSYHQHGPQLQIGNYGLAYVDDMMQWINILRGTPFAFEENKVSILRNYLLEGQQWVTWKKRYDISSCGRQIFPGTQKSKANSLDRCFEQMKQVDPGYEKQYQKANQFQNLKGNKYFWRSDYQIQRAVNYFFSVKTSSNRTIGSETVNSENNRGYYMGDGATFIYQNTKEYEDIFPFWDWRKIPGVTAHQEEITSENLRAGKERNQSDFVGGVTDGMNGISVMEYNRRGLNARKSWFMFNDLIVCLGSGINSSIGFPVTTSVNQSYFQGGLLNDKENRWILHDKTGYIFPLKTNFILKTDTVSGKWSDVASRFSPEIQEAPLFRLWIEHGENPKDEFYSYILVPNATQSRLKKYSKNPPFVIKNEKHRQEVVSESGEIAGIVFYKAGKSQIFGGIEVDKPCVLMLKRENKIIRISVADPTQKNSEIYLTLNGQYSGEKVNSQGDKTFVKLLLPQNGEAGSTVTLELKN